MNRKRSGTWLLLLAVVTALALRLVTLERKSLWIDELETLRISALGIDDISTGQSDQNPPAYHLLMHYWTKLGQREFILRLPSALAGAAAIPLLYRLVREWADQWSAIASAWMLAIAPLHIWYSQEARTYILACTLGLASTLFYALTIRREKSLIWLGWIVATIAGLYAHYSVLLLIFVQIGLFGPLWKINDSKRSVLWTALFALLVMAMLFVPQARTFMAQFLQSGWQGGYYYILAQSTLTKLGISISSSQFYTVVIVTAVLTLGTVIASSWIVLGRSKRIHIGIGVISVAMVFYLLILTASAVPRGMGIKRQVLILLPYVLSGIAVLVSTAKYRTYLLIALVLVTLPVTGQVVVVQEQEDWRAAAHLIEENTEPQDIILLNASYMQQAFDYYYRGDRPRQGIEVSHIPETLPDITASHQRVWLILSQDNLTDPQGKVQRWFDDNCTLLEERTFTGVRVRLYNAEKPPD